MDKLEIFLANEQASLSFGATLAQICCRHFPTGVIYLYGQLGAGKTTLIRAFLQSLGVTGSVKSPTYTLVEPYIIENKQFYHFDLYRMSDPEELEYIGARDYFTADTLCFIEWPERGKGWLPDPGLVIELFVENNGRRVAVQGSTMVVSQLNHEKLLTNS